MSTPKQQFIPGTVDARLAEIADAKKRLAECEKFAATAKRDMQKAALLIAERVAVRLAMRPDTPGDLAQACASYLNARNDYLSSTADGGKAAQEIVEAIQEDA